MIGDHKQLRPKCQHYPLAVEPNRGFDLNRSLFERLAIAPGFRLAVVYPDLSPTMILQMLQQSLLVLFFSA